MSLDEDDFSLPDPDPAPAPPPAPAPAPTFGAIMDIPLSVQVVLGGTTMPVASLMKLGRGAVIPLDHRVGQPVDIVVNGRVIARGDMTVMAEDGTRLGVSLTEIVGQAAPAKS